MLVVQLVTICWTKATRGAPLSNLRAELPRAFAIDGAPAACRVQRHGIAEWDGFAPAPVQLESLAALPGSVGVLRVAPHKDGVLSLGILGTPFSGQPPRRAIPDAITLLPGQWARLVLNARHTSSRGQYYCETVFNVAWGEAIARDCFLAGAADHVLDLKADLF